jgi:hypothetical protein
MSELPKLVQARLYAPVMETHPDADVLTAFCERALPEGERQSVVMHLAKCKECREVAALALPPLESAAPSVLDRNESAWMRSGWIRWASVVACVAVVGAAVMLRPKSGPASYHTGSEESVVLPDQRTGRQTDQVAPQSDKGTSTKPAANEVGTRESAPALTAVAPDGVHSVPVPVAPKQAAAPKPGTVSNAVPARVMATPSEGRPANSQVAGAITQKEATTLPLNGRNFTQLVNVTPSAGSRDAGKFEYSESAPAAGSAAPSAPPAGVSQTVELSGAAAAVSVLDQPAEIGRAKTAPAPTARAQTGQDEAKSLGMQKKSEGVRMLAAPTGEPVHWMLQLPQGQLQRSFDGGATWEPAPVVDKTKFTVFSVAGQDIWAGGASGLLFHSSDGGTHWTLIKPAIDGEALAADITAVKFTDSNHGTLTTSDGQTWSTSDGGKNWKR